MCTAQNECCRDSTQTGAHEADRGIKIAEITEGAWELALMERFYWFVSIL